MFFSSQRTTKSALGVFFGVIVSKYFSDYFQRILLTISKWLCERTLIGQFAVQPGATFDVRFVRIEILKKRKRKREKHERSKVDFVRTRLCYIFSELEKKAIVVLER